MAEYVTQIFQSEIIDCIKFDVPTNNLYILTDNIDNMIKKRTIPLHLLLRHYFQIEQRLKE